MTDNRNKIQEDKTTELTKGNTPNDDEEVLKNNNDNDPDNDTCESKNEKKTDGSETIGIP